MKEARAQLDRELQAQEELKKETAEQPKNQPFNRREKTTQAQKQQAHAAEAAQKQARLEFDTKETTDLLKDAAKESPSRSNLPKPQ